MTPRHLQDRRPRKDRDVTWGRRYDANRHTITWTFWRRDGRRALHCLSRAFPLNDIIDAPPVWVPHALRYMHRELRNTVDDIDLALMEQTA